MKKMILVTGRSGAGKATTLQILEDLGYYTIDNLPVALIAEVVQKLDQDIEQFALAVDVRGLQKSYISVDEMWQGLQHYPEIEVLYLTCREDVLLNRYMSSRRPHPLAKQYDSLTECIRVEEQLLDPIYRRATMTIDTTNLNIHELRQQLSMKLGQNDQLTVILQSFGFKHGVPMDTDYVFDVRHLVNPYWVAELRSLTGLDSAVQEFLLADNMVNLLYDDIYQFLEKWLPILSQRNRHFITISVGCTGGQHRSVYFVDRLRQALQAKWAVQTIHREMKYWS